MQIRYLKAIWRAFMNHLVGGSMRAPVRSTVWGRQKMATLADEMGESSAQAIEKREIHL